MTAKDKISEACELIGAESIGNDYYVYYATETSEWWRVSGDELSELSDLMHDDDEYIRADAYSHWCAGSPGQVVIHTGGILDGMTVDEVMAQRAAFNRIVGE